MEWVETTGRTVAEALDAALDQLGVDEQEAEVQVLQEPQKGLFGRLRAEARVRARVRPARPRPKAERRDRRRRGERDGRGRRGNGRGSAVASSARSGGGRSPSGNGTGKGARTAERAARDGEPAAPAGSPAAAAGPGGEANERRDAGQERGAAGSGSETRSGRRRRRGGGGAREQGAAVSNETRQATEGIERTELEVADLDAQRDAVDEFLRGLLGAFGRPEANVSVRTVDGDTLEAEVQGEELGLLVGPKGQTLQAVHELVRSVVQRRFVGEAHARVRVDVAGYRQRRREALERFTRSVAEQVLESGRAVALDPMGASDRKTVHDVVNEIDGVKTVSEGDEPARRVIIQPA